jgi:hypothetical protein
VTGADAEVGGGQHDVRRRLPEVVHEQVLLAGVLRLPDDEGDRRRGPGNVPRPLPDLRQLDQLRAIGDDNKVPRLPVARGRGLRPASRMRSRSARAIGWSVYWRTLRRARMVSQVSLSPLYARGDDDCLVLVPWLASHNLCPDDHGHHPRAAQVGT